MTLILLLGLVAGLYMLWLVFNLAAYALPLYIGIGTAVWLLHHGHGLAAAGALGFLAGIVALSTGQLLFDVIRSPTLRLIIAVAFVAPAGLAGYQLVHGLVGLALGNGLLLTVMSAIGGVFVAGSAWRQLTAPSFAEPSRRSRTEARLPAAPTAASRQRSGSDPRLNART